jgi:hypothetical protein
MSWAIFAELNAWQKQATESGLSIESSRALVAGEPNDDH